MTAKPVKISEAKCLQIGGHCYGHTVHAMVEALKGEDQICIHCGHIDHVTMIKERKGRD